MAEVKSIKCKSCHAPLNPLLKSRVLSIITCDYCGQQHDIKKDFKKLHHFKNKFHQYSSIALGTKGKIKGIEFTIVGYVVYADRNAKDLDEDEFWIEYQIYSKTHGFAFLSYEEGEYSFYHRVREISSPPLSIFDTKKRDMVEFREEQFKVSELYSAYIVAVVGSLTWYAKVGEKSNCIDAKVVSNPNILLSYERSQKEEEYYLGEPIQLGRDFLDHMQEIEEKDREPDDSSEDSVDSYFSKTSNSSDEEGSSYLFPIILLVIFIVVVYGYLSKDDIDKNYYYYEVDVSKLNLDDNETETTSSSSSSVPSSNYYVPIPLSTSSSSSYSSTSQPSSPPLSSSTSSSSSSSSSYKPSSSYSSKSSSSSSSSSSRSVRRSSSSNSRGSGGYSYGK